MKRLLHRVHSWLRSVSGRDRVESDMEDEIRFHLEARAADLMREGLDFSQAMRQVDRDLPLMDVRTQQEQIDATTQQERMFASLSAGFGVLALALACVGIYGIRAYTVVQRTNEIGIRLALGAERRQVRGMVMRETGWLALFGVLAGLGVALGLGRLVKSMLYGLQPADPVSLAGAGCLLLAVALVAGWVPAMRASRVESLEALRHE